MDMVLGQGFQFLQENELLSVEGGWSWADTLTVIGGVGVIVGAGIVIGASAPISIPAAVAVGATTGKVIGLVSSLTLAIGLNSK